MEKDQFSIIAVFSRNIKTPRRLCPIFLIKDFSNVAHDNRHLCPDRPSLVNIYARQHCRACTVSALTRAGMPLSRETKFYKHPYRCDGESSKSVEFSIVAARDERLWRKKRRNNKCIYGLTLKTDSTRRLFLSPPLN